MSTVFGRNFYNQREPNFSGLFRLIDDWDHHTQAINHVANQNGQRAIRRTQTFTPKFDMKETDAVFELHGELPGIERDQVHIEFTDPQTLVVRGRIERSFQAGTPPAGLIDNAPQMSGAITEGGEKQEASDRNGRTSPPAPTVEDENEDGGNTTTTSTAQSTPATTNTEVVKPVVHQPPKDQHKYWISERSIGEFSRSFSFPSRVDSEGVEASLKDGVLTVTVPKSKKHESRRIAVN